MAIKLQFVVKLISHLFLYNFKVTQVFSVKSRNLELSNSAINLRLFFDICRLVFSAVKCKMEL